MPQNILHITPDFNYACGRSYYVFLLLKYFKQKNYKLTLLTNKGDSFDRLDELEIPYIKIKSLHSKNPISLTKNISKVSEIIKDNKIDIIHTHHRYSELIAVHCAKKKVKTVLTSLSLVNSKYNIEYKSDKIIAVSDTIRLMLEQRFHLQSKRIEVIHNFTDTDEIHELELLASHPKDHGKYFNILSIGRFHQDKNFEVLLKAIQLINDKNIKTIIIGEGESHNEYETYINKNKLNVELIIPQKNLLEYFLLADLCVLPSNIDPFPNFMLQSGLHKKAFIGTNIDGIGELIKDGYNGLLFERDNEYQLAEKIIRAKSDLNLRNALAENLYRDVINNYTQEFIIPKIENLYASL